ncbi:Hypothetical predicted protein, partial [Pelobates cultripes]
NYMRQGGENWLKVASHWHPVSTDGKGVKKDKKGKFIPTKPTLTDMLTPPSHISITPNLIPPNYTQIYTNLLTTHEEDIEPLLADFLRAQCQ